MFAEHYITTIGPVKITVTPPEQPPRDVDVIVEEQDTNLVQGHTHIVNDTGESYETLISKMLRQTPLVPGTVIVRHTTPKRFIAIIYDIGKKPIYRLEWTAAALHELLHEMKTYQTRNIAMPLLGVTYGRCPVTDFMDLLCTVLPAGHTGYPEMLWLITPLPEYRRTIAYLENRRP